jgi:replicative DNA helicase
VTPAQTQKAEQAILGALLLDGAALAKAPKLRAAHFADGMHRRIFTAIQQAFAAGKPVDVLTVATTSEADAGYVFALADGVPSARNAERYAEIVIEAATHRAIRAAAADAMEIAQGEEGTREKLDAIAQAFAGLQSSATRMPRQIGEIAAARTEFYEALEAGTMPPAMATHIPGLDRMLNGGLRGGGLYVLAARPSVGKTSFSMQVLMALAGDGRPGLMLSQEMPSESVVDRAVASAGRINGEALLSGRMRPDDWNRAVEALERLAGLPVWIDDQPAQSLLDMRAKARAVKGLKAIVVDYLQLCESSLKRESRTAQVGEISRGLKALAKELDVAVIALSQLNREVEKRPGRRPILSDLRDSGEIEQDADAVLFLWPIRDETEFDPCRRIGLEVAKNRAGRKGTLVLQFDGGIQHWGESTETVEKLTERPARGRMTEL